MKFGLSQNMPCSIGTESMYSAYKNRRTLLTILAKAIVNIILKNYIVSAKTKIFMKGL